MSDGPDRFGRYDPFDDTEGWPSRDSPAPPSSRDGEREQGPDPVSDPVAGESDRLSSPMLEIDDAEPGMDSASRAPDGEEAVETPFVDEAEQGVEGLVESVEETPPLEAVEQAAAPEVVATPIVEEGSEESEQSAESEEEVPEHAAGALLIPGGHVVVEGAPNGFRRTVAIVVGRFNGDISNRLLSSALEALEDAHVAKESITIVPVPGAFELPLAAMALAKTRRYSCVVALGCVIRGETPHFDFVAGEAASGLQLAAIETGIPVSFGVLTCETSEQAEARVGKGAEAALAALEMAELFSQLRTAAAASR